MQDGTSKSRMGDRDSEPDLAMPWLDSIDELQLPPAEDSVRKTWQIAGTAILLMILFSGLLWYLYGRSSIGDPNAPFLVQAPEGPTKVEPEDRGGMEVPHQERLVFGRVSGENPPMTEKVTESPEEPMERPQPTPEPEPPVAETPSPSEPTIEPPRVEEAPQPEVQPSEPKVTLAGAFRLQLGAFGSEDVARTSWQGMQNRQPSLLGGLDFELEPVSVGSRTLYRLRVGPFASRFAAEDTCTRLKAAGLDCLVVVP